MPDRPRKAPFANPFYTLLLVASTAFVLTALGYTVSLFVLEQAHSVPKPGPRSASLALADWLDRNGATALAAELAVMIVTGLLAMATDRYFMRSGRPEQTAPKSSKDGRQ
jgi:hypothetical protein